MIFNQTKFNSHWPTKTLNQLGEFNRGKSKHRPRNDKVLFEGGKYPLIQTGDIRQANFFIEKHTEVYNEFGLQQSKLWPANTLCITIAANIAETALLAYPMCFPDSVVGFNAYQNESSEIFMHYVFSYIKKSIQNSVSGSIQDNINIGYLTNLKFKIPTKNERERIEKVLSTLDAKIALNNKINAELEGMAKLLYDYWFVQFDFPDEQGRPYKSSGGKMVYNEVLKREVPEGWEVKFLVEEMDVQYGYPFSTKLFSSDQKGKPVVRIRDILKNTISTYSSEIVDEKYTLKKMDLVIGMDGNFHMNFWDKENCWLNQRCLRIRETQNSRVSNYQAFQDIKPYIEARQKNVSRTTVGHLSAKDVNRLNVLCAPETRFFKHKSFFDSIIKKVIHNRNENQHLTELRDWLLPMLMNGQVRVGE